MILSDYKLYYKFYIVNVLNKIIKRFKIKYEYQ